MRHRICAGEKGCVAAEYCGEIVQKKTAGLQEIYVPVVLLFFDDF